MEKPNRFGHAPVPFRFPPHELTYFLVQALSANVMRGPHTPQRTTARRASTPFWIVRTRPRHADGVAHVIRRAHGVGDDKPCASCPTPAIVRQQIVTFPHGQFVAVSAGGDQERVLGAAMLMRTDYPPSERPRKWLQAIGGLDLRNHDPNGRWLYGVDMAVDPAVQGQGVGSALYRRRQALVRELVLDGMYAGGMLKGYRHYRNHMSPSEYAVRVRSGEIDDPTVTMQLNRGFRAAGVIEEYADDPESGNCAMLIVWRPGADQRPRRPRRAHDAERNAAT